ncbi:MAG: DNA topoisomerase 3, partial [Magnetococcales bacterium]|nr:DNA topoisomerase 3 [Magnetococcales bacterium]
EKPSQARDIGRVLGVTSRRNGYLEGQGKRVTWCIGHLLEMTVPDGYKPEWKSWRLDTLPLIPEQWKLEATTRGKKQLTIVKGLLKGVHEVVLATDADREGETIGREVLEYCRYRGPITRLWLSALDDASIRKALSQILPGEKTESLYQAGLGRSRSDWLVGMNLSRAYTILGRQGGYDGVLTVGRVQTPTLKLVVDRDRLIENFKPVDFFDVIGHFRVENGAFKSKWIPKKKHADEEGRCLDKTIAKAVIQKVQGQTGQISKAQTKRMKEPPPLPLALSNLQQEASKRWSMSAKRTLEVAQALYEKHKAITYPRTDCRFLPKSQFSDVPKVLHAMMHADAALSGLVQSADPTIRSRAWNDKKITAHHAIIPTAAQIGIGGMSRDEVQIYDLIRRHYLAQFFPYFEYDRTVISSVVKDELFRTSGRVERVSGWKQVLGAVDKRGKDPQEPMLPLVKKGEPTTVEKAELASKKTKPPNRYTEGTLIQAMKNVGKLVEDQRLRKILRETAGIGTEATRAAIIENLLKRQLLTKEGKKNLVSMPAGRALVDVLPHSVTDPATTAVWEQVLDDIAYSDGSLDEFLDKSVLWINKLIANVKARQSRGINSFAGIASPMVKTGRRKPGTGAAPDARYPCPVCGQPMCRRQSQRGWFWGCSTFPTCKATMPDSQGKPIPRSEVAPPADSPSCPKCKSGHLLTRTAKSGQNAGNQFMGCSEYPKCRHTQPI